MNIAVFKPLSYRYVFTIGLEFLDEVIHATNPCWITFGTRAFAFMAVALTGMVTVWVNHAVSELLELVL